MEEHDHSVWPRQLHILCTANVLEKISVAGKKENTFCCTFVLFILCAFNQVLYINTGYLPLLKMDVAVKQTTYCGLA